MFRNNEALIHINCLTVFTEYSYFWFSVGLRADWLRIVGRLIEVERESNVALSEGQSSPGKTD